MYSPEFRSAARRPAHAGAIRGLEFRCDRTGS